MVTGDYLRCLTVQLALLSGGFRAGFAGRRPDGFSPALTTTLATGGGAVLTVGSLFTGIGGFDLGLERAGMRVVWQCESDDFCRRVLAKHWPDVPCYPDVSKLRGTDVERPVVLAGGFPCQDVSVVGKRAGIDGPQSGLWAEMFRVLCELRPRYLVVENVTGLLSAGLGRVLGDLASCGYDAEWDCVPASAVGAHHERDRFWLVAYPGGARRRQDAGSASGDEGADEGWPAQHNHIAGGDGQGSRARDVADAASNRRRPGRTGRSDSGGARQPESERAFPVADPDGDSKIGTPIAWAQRHPWPAEPDVARMAHGIPNGVDRRRALGNALVPQIAEWIGRRIVTYDQARSVSPLRDDRKETG